jgi:hypothetical protein
VEPRPRVEDAEVRQWKKVLWVSIGVGVAGGALWLLGRHEIRDANTQLCGDPSGCPLMAVPDTELFDRTAAEVRRGEHLRFFGAVAAATGVGLAGLSVYRIRRARAAGVGRTASMAPVAGPRSAGAVLRVTW